MRLSNRSFFTLVVLGVTLVIGTLLALHFLLPPAQYSLGTIELATTNAARERGLSGRENIPANYGMLFVFPQAGNYGFWMRDMKTSIDIVWLASDSTILGIEEGVSPDSYPHAFFPPSPARYVLETRAGEARVQGWSVGTHLDLPI